MIRVNGGTAASVREYYPRTSVCVVTGGTCGLSLLLLMLLFLWVMVVIVVVVVVGVVNVPGADSFIAHKTSKMPFVQT